MNINTTLSVSQKINLSDLDPAVVKAADRPDVVSVYDAFSAQINALSAVVDILAECGSTTLDAGKLYFLFSDQERGFNSVLADFEQLL